MAEIDTEALRRATTALYLQLPAAVAEDYCPRAMAAADEIDRLRAALAEAEAEFAQAMESRDRHLTRANELEAALRAAPVAAQEEGERPLCRGTGYLCHRPDPCPEGDCRMGDGDPTRPGAPSEGGRA